VENPPVSSGSIVYPVIGLGSFQPFGRMGPILVETTNIFDLTIQVKLEEVSLGFNLGISAVADGITRFGKPFDPLPFKSDIKIVQPVVFHFSTQVERFNVHGSRLKCPIMFLTIV